MNTKPRAPLKMGQSDTLIAHAFALADTFGIPDRDMAAAAMRAAVAMAEKQKDPDGWLALLAGLPKQETSK